MIYTKELIYLCLKQYKKDTVHSHDNMKENMHFLALCTQKLPNKTFNVIAQWLLFVSVAAHCEPHKNSKAKWIRIWEKRWLNQTQWIGGD